MNRLLRQVGFSDKELELYRNETGLFAALIGADERRFEVAAERLPENFDLSFKSIRKLLKLLLKTVLQDLAALQKKDEQPAILQAAIPMPVAVAAAMNELNPAARISSSEYLIIYLSGILFDVFQNLCSPGKHTCGRCGLNLCRERLFKNPTYPKPAGIVSCLGYCDEIYKTGERLTMENGIEHLHLKGLPVDFDSQRAYLGKGLKSFIVEHTGATGGEAAACLGRCNNRVLEISILLNKINHLIAADRHACVTFNETSLLNLFNLIWLPAHFENGKEILGTFIRELREKQREGRQVIKNPLRIGCMHLAFTNPFVDRCFRRNGAAVIVSSFYEASADGSRASTEFERCAEAFYGDRAPGNIAGKAENIDRIIEKYDIDSFLFGQFENDRALGGDQLIIMKLLRHKEKMHYMTMNNWAVMSEQSATRIESLVEILKEKSNENIGKNGESLLIMSKKA